MNSIRNSFGNFHKFVHGSHWNFLKRSFSYQLSQRIFHVFFEGYQEKLLHKSYYDSLKKKFLEQSKKSFRNFANDFLENTSINSCRTPFWNLWKNFSMESFRSFSRRSYSSALIGGLNKFFFECLTWKSFEVSLRIILGLNWPHVYLSVVPSRKLCRMFFQNTWPLV